MKQWFENPPPFHPFSGQHIAVLALAMCLTIFLCAVARSGKAPRLVTWQNRVLAALMLVAFPVKVWEYWMAGAGLPLPMHLCDWVAFIAVGALLTGNRFLAELTYFWGLAGTTNGLLTPDLAEGFPHPRFFVFFTLHAGVIVTAIYLVVGLRLTPRKGAVMRCFLWIQFYLVCAFAANLIFDANYGFLRGKPAQAQGTLLDLLGPYPWYILSMELLCLGLFLFFNAPFYLNQRREAAAGQG